MLRVAVVDSHRAFAQIVAARLDQVADIAVAGVATAGAAVADLLGASPVDVLVIDAALVDEAGAMVSQSIERVPELLVVVLVGEADPRLAVEALVAGASGMINKSASFDELVAAIRGAACGETWVSPRLLTGVLDELLPRPRRSRTPDPLRQLTGREREVLGCMVSGMNRAAIARSLFLSPNTVRKHTGNVLSKLGAHSTLEAVAMARQAGLTGGAEARSTIRP